MTRPTMNGKARRTWRVAHIASSAGWMVTIAVLFAYHAATLAHAVTWPNTTFADVSPILSLVAGLTIGSSIATGAVLLVATPDLLRRKWMLAKLTGIAVAGVLILLSRLFGPFGATSLVGSAAALLVIVFISSVRREPTGVIARRTPYGRHARTSSSPDTTTVAYLMTPPHGTEKASQRYVPVDETETLQGTKALDISEVPKT